MRALALVLVFTLSPALVPSSSAAAVTDAQRAEAVRHYRNGEELMRQETFELAVVEFRAAVKLDPAFVLAHYSMGQALMALRRYPEAVDAFLGCKGAIEEFNALSLRDRGEAERRITDEVRDLKDHIAAIQSGRIKTVSGNATIISLEERVRVLEESRMRGAENRGAVPAEFSLALGSAYLRWGKLEDAEREYLAAIAVNPKLGAAHNNLAFVYMTTGRLDEAEKSIKLAEKSGFPVNPRFKDDLKKARAEAKP
ncbi:MAG TPA: tetratricopeptide repeat protein [Vicinamibacteria bacterium]|nr:tetratricopeptide repeat protein [Vicinamibacteria bacterium]